MWKRTIRPQTSRVAMVISKKRACDNMKNIINRFVFFVGWILSPFTFWNDAFVNIPLSYVAASLLARFIHMQICAIGPCMLLA